MKPFFKIKELMPGIFAITGEAVVRYLIIGKHHALLFDTGYGFADLKEFIETLTDLPLYVVISHGHVDHAGGNWAFDCPVYMHPADMPVFEQHQSFAFRNIGLRFLQKVQRIFFIAPFIIPRGFDEETYLNRPLIKNFLPVEEGYVFDLGGVTAEVNEIPGHTPGSIGLYCREKRLFFASDGINGGTWLFLPESCRLSVYQDSLEKADRLNFDYLLTGHSTKLVPKAMMKDYIAVAKNPDFEHAKVSPETVFTPGVKQRTCREKAMPGKKQKNKAHIVISAEKL